ncbi:MAG TPA: TetR/AcrR family transcriptional regulator [Rhizomicrobium sp.]|nr:TetR/AcrR family transcriptional regulator [Rhizomicrobium sp.]
MDAALELFNERTFADTTMEQIARRAGASTKTLYARYADKAEVVEAVVNRIVEGNLAAHAAAGKLDPQQIAPRDFIIGLGTRIIEGISGEGAGLISIAFSEARRFPVITRMYNAVLSRGRGIFRDALESWHGQGLLPDLTDPELAAKALMSLLTDMARIRTAMGDPMSKAEIDTFIPYAADLFLRGCGYRAKK